MAWVSTGGVIRCILVSMSERTPYEKDTLIFSSPTEAREFTASVEGQWARPGEGAVTKRDVVKNEVARRIEDAGEVLQTIHQPWPHTDEEHADAQQLVDLAFQKNLRVALREAKKRAYYPRNLDLFHDLLTGEMYDLVRETGMNSSPLLVWALEIMGILLVAGLAVVLLFVAFFGI